MTTPAHLRDSSPAMLRGVDNLAGPSGRIEALLNEGRPHARYSVLLAHPHPLGGGTMHNKVVYRAMKVFQGYGLPVLRFNFRGAGLSEGQHDEGRGEVDDVRAGLDWLERQFRLPILFAGFSFGANVGLRACCGDARVHGIVAIGIPVQADGRQYRYHFLPGCTQPKLFLSGAEDEYGPEEAVRAIAATAAPPAELVLIAAADHFFTGKLEEMQLALGNWVEAHFLPAQGPRAEPRAEPRTETMTGEGDEKRLALLHLEARRIFADALEASSISAAFDNHFRFAGRQLLHHGEANGNRDIISLDDYQKIYVIALGKAALSMLDTLLQRLPRDLSLEGVCSAPSLPRQRHENILYYAGGHPFPNADSFRAANAALRLGRSAGKDTLVFFLISGGGSALCEAPLDKRISLEDTVAFHKALVGAGATIREINTVRKHFSAVKGGRLAVAAAPAAKFSLLVSDVPGSQLDVLASAPTLPDSSTVEDCREILARYHLLEQFPASVRRFFTDPGLPETPGKRHARRSPAVGGAGTEEQGGAGTEEQEKETRRREGTFSIPADAPNEPAPRIGPPVAPASQPGGFANSRFDLLLANRDLVAAATEAARVLGFAIVVDNTCDDWDYRDAAQYLLARFQQLRREYPSLCLLSGGEVTVRLESNAGAGGRNQQFALACALELADCGRSKPSHGSLPSANEAEGPVSDSPIPDSGIVVLSAGSDGVDGNSPAAGAIADSTTVARAKNCGFDAMGSLANFDAYPLFNALGDSVVTGPTNNNLRDLRIILSR